MPKAIIDPPVGPFSNPDDIRSWIEELRTFPDCEETRQAKAEAEQMLSQRLARDER